MPDQSSRPVIGPPLKITLVTDVSELVPEDATTLAQANSHGLDQGSVALAAMLPANTVSSTASSDPEKLDRFLDAAAESAAINSSESEILNSEMDDLNRQQLMENIDLAYLNSQSNPREKYVSSRTRENKYAAYIEKWRLLVERVGNLNYPEEALQQKLEGSLVLDVAINADGSVNKVRILDDSGYKILDDAASRIVHIAAPFDRFPDAFRSEIDTLHIVRTWQFKQNRVSSHGLQLE